MADTREVVDDNESGSDHWSYQEPSRWWFTSAAFPMIAATLGPAASTFSICALVKPWRQHLPPGATIDTASYIDDPPWLTAINATQLGIAVLANMALFLNMSRRVSFTIAQPITIVGWYISSFALIALTATASGPLIVEPAAELIWSQAFYYAIYAAVLYFLIASLMLLTYLSALTGHSPKDFALTASQRTLMLQTLMFLLYLLIGALVFTAIEGWSYLDGFYWAAVTLFTVGLGDFYPTTPLAKGLLVPFALVGIITLGLVIGSIRSLVIDRGKTRLGARLLEKMRRRTLKRIRQRGNVEILVPHRHDPALTELERREREFALMRRVQTTTARRRRWGSMLVSTGSWLVLWLVGAYVFQRCEEPYQGWNYRDSFYFAFISLTTIGYGDLTPISNAGKSFWVFWAMTALPTMTVFISDASDTVVRLIRDGTDWVARLTILPGEDSFRKDLKKFLRMLSFGLLLGQDVKQARDGQLEDPRPGHPTSADTRADEDETPELLRNNIPDPEAAVPYMPSADQGFSWLARAEEGARGTHANAEPTKSSRSQSPSIPFTFPSTRQDYLITLVNEIRRVTRHLKRDPPRKYSFREWAWYLRLIGENEADADMHRRPKLGPRHQLGDSQSSKRQHQPPQQDMGPARPNDGFDWHKQQRQQRTNSLELGQSPQPANGFA
ncbi:hypothetical protein VTJ49DRAFT_573 [Mycothermus thermophilus]|uniref:Potassium channel domain-containing protein n=1 Tax=Humicola insolens TaxID=85995 RepID=A0ABR3VES2_HUMIN